jgi:hypothetical protein
LVAPAGFQNITTNPETSLLRIIEVKLTIPGVRIVVPEKEISSVGRWIGVNPLKKDGIVQSINALNYGCG